jgi:hypothetical protein
MTTPSHENGTSETSRGRAEGGVAVGQERAPEGVFSALNAGGRGQDLRACPSRAGQDGLHWSILAERGL